MKLCHTGATGNFARRLNTLAGLICGIVSTKSCHLPHVARKIPDATLAASREKRLSRCLKNKEFKAETYFLPFAKLLLLSLSHLPLVLVMDGSTVGRGCVALVVALV